jgi:hypothetical protein
VPQESLASEGGVILQKVVDVPDPIVFLSRTCALSLSIESWVWYRRPVDAGNRMQRRADRDRFSGFQNMGGLSIHGYTGRCTAAITYLQIDVNYVSEKWYHVQHVLEE